MQILDSCDPTGTCRAECPEAIAEVRAENSCIRDRWDYFYDFSLTYAYDMRQAKFLLAMESCSGRYNEVATTTAGPKAPVTTTKPRGE